MKHNPFFWPDTTMNRSSTAFGRMILGITLLLAMMSLTSPAAHAQTYVEQTLHSFAGDTADGAASYGSLTNVNGTLYGTTLYGGTNSSGTIFSVKPDGTGFTTLYSFTATNGSSANNDGAYPHCGLVNVNGTLYGTTEYGGYYGKGSVFTFNLATNTEKAVYSFFGGTSDGGYPQASITLVNGLLYGTTLYGGANNKGTMFSIDTFSNAEKLIYSFGASTTDAAYPYGSLTYDGNSGKFFGTTSNGGSLGYGTVFAIDPTAKTEHILHAFTGTNTNYDGSNPFASLTLVNGTLYGTTSNGGAGGYGTIFSINTNGSDYQTLYSFTNSVGDGAYSYASLTYDSGSGKLFGTTYNGGVNYGTVFSWDPATESETTIYRFSAEDSSGYNAGGAAPYAGVLDINGILYGTTVKGGTIGYGTVFSLTPVTVPTAHTDGCSIKYNTARTNAAPGVLSNDDNGGEGPLTAVLVSNVTHGTLVLHSDGGFTYTPNKGYAGKDVFTYQAVNPIGHSNTTTCTFTVLGAAPTANTDGASIKLNTARTFAAPGVLGNDDNGGEGPLTATLVSNVSHGTLALHSDGSFIYTPNTGYVGKDVFTYQAVNPVGKSNTTTCTLTVVSTPTAHNDGASIAHNTARTFAAPGVLSNDDNGGSSPMTAALVSNVTHGTLTLHSDGSFTYTPNTGYSGTDTFTYRVSNPLGAGTIGTVTLTVQ